MDEERYLYGEDRRGEERDPRKRKRQSPGTHEKENRKYDDPKESSRRRRRDPSGSPEYDRRRRRSGHQQEDWKKKSEEFLNSLNSPQEIRGSKIETFVGNTGPQAQQPPYGFPYASQPSYPPYSGSNPGYGAPPPGYQSYRNIEDSPSHPRASVQDPRYGREERTREGRDRSDSKSRMVESERKDDKEWRRMEERRGEVAREDKERKTADGGEKQSLEKLLTPEQREKLIKQREHYEKNCESLEDQLLKLKEQRESLKNQGNKHEDNIMKENAKLQKEVKHRILYMKEWIEKIETGLEEDMKAAKEKERERVWREEARIREELRRKEVEKGWDSSPERKKKIELKLKKERASSSDSSVDSDRDAKKKKKKQRKSSASESSDSDAASRKKPERKKEEDMVNLVADIKSKKRKGSREEETLMELVAKLSEGYNKTKQENAELTSRCTILENQNRVLKRQVEELQKLNALREAPESRTIRNLEYASQSVDVRKIKRETGSNLLLSEYGGKEVKSEYTSRGRAGGDYDTKELASDYQKERLPDFADIKSEYGGKDEYGGRNLVDYPVDSRKQEKFFKESRERSRSFDNRSKYKDEKENGQKYKEEKGSRNLYKEESKSKGRDARDESRSYKEENNVRKGKEELPDRKFYEEIKIKTIHSESSEQKIRHEKKLHHPGRRHETSSSSEEEERVVRRTIKSKEKRGRDRSESYEVQKKSPSRDLERHDRHIEKRDRSRSRNERKYIKDERNSRRSSSREKGSKKRRDIEERQERDEDSDSARESYEQHQQYKRYYGEDDSNDEVERKGSGRDRERKRRDKDRSTSRSDNDDRRQSRSKDRKHKRRSKSTSDRSTSHDRRSRHRSSNDRSSKDHSRQSKKEKNGAIDLEEWSKPPSKDEKDPGLSSLKEKMRAKEEKFREEENQNKWIPAEISTPTEPPPESSRQSQERPFSPSRPSLNISWGQGVKKQLDIPLPGGKKTTPIVGKMPWLKKDTGRASKFGPPISGLAASVPPPTLVTAVPTLGQPAPPPVPSAPMVQPPSVHPTASVNASNDFGFNSSVPPPPLPVAPLRPKVDRNPKPSAVDIQEMLAAAQKHMQQSLNTKLQSIGVPPNIAGGMTDGAEEIPLPMDMPVGPPSMPTAPPPHYHPTPHPDSGWYNQAPEGHMQMESMEDDCRPPGDEPDADELAMLGIDPTDSIF